jgi:protein translocase SEC61 complex gamma subunit
MNILGALKNFIDNSRHVLNISYRPTNEEFKRSAKMIIITILIIGVAGFIIGIIVSLITTGTIPIASF